MDQIAGTGLELRDPSLLAERSFVAGNWIDANSKRTFPVANPSTGEVIARMADCGQAETARAIDAAYAAQREWAAKLAHQRSAILMRWYELMVANADDLGAILCAEMGKPFPEARGEILYGASFIQWFAEEGKRVYGDTIPAHKPGARLVVVKQPVGVVGSITPWNFPNAMIARKVGPALAVGCAVVAKPAKATPLSATAMAVLAERAGMPAGVLNVVCGSSSAAIGDELCRNEKVRKITFTGSTEVGRVLLEKCAHDIKKASMELGGNAPFIVFDDADLDAAVAGAMVSKYRNAGQTCVCANRLYVQAGIYDAFAAKLVKAVEALKVGDGFEEGVTIGPLIDEAAVMKVEEHVADALAKGGKVATGGERIAGNFYRPTVLTGITASMKVAREETFGPVAPLFRFESEAEAIAAANDTEFGLAAYFYSRDIGRCWRVAEALEYGIIGINDGLPSTAVAPFGGVKQSGLGREGSKYGVEDYLEIKYLCMGGI
ncbi:MAG TPA: NAD-dependent succinate-semialdehyde dehydrogenase [Paracoccaceae bacterium]|nr:NAD-dependent succinate-semialdehyde dehydrogenase [Paracoccaceae bacterium]